MRELQHQAVRSGPQHRNDELHHCQVFGPEVPHELRQIHVIRIVHVVMHIPEIAVIDKYRPIVKLASVLELPDCPLDVLDVVRGVARTSVVFPKCKIVAAHRIDSPVQHVADPAHVAVSAD